MVLLFNGKSDNSFVCVEVLVHLLPSTMVNTVRIGLGYGMEFNRRHFFKHGQIC